MTPLLDYFVKHRQITHWRDYCHAAHDAIGQKRKYTGEPYWTHCDAVAEIFLSYMSIWRFTEEEMLAGVIALLGHDLFEDVAPQCADGYTADDIYAAIPGDPPLARALIHALTDVFTSDRYPHLNRRVRKNLEAGRLHRPYLAGVPDHARWLAALRVLHTAKMCDLIHNSATILDHDPKFATTYLEEKALLVEMLDLAAPVLAERAGMTTEMKISTLLRQ